MLCPAVPVGLEGTVTVPSPLFLSSAVFHPHQVLIGTDSITNLHKLEQVSSDEGIGTLAENLLEALREHPEVNKKIDAARKETRAEKKRMAMAMRQKALGTLGMTVMACCSAPSGLFFLPCSGSAAGCVLNDLFVGIAALQPPVCLVLPGGNTAAGRWDGHSSASGEHGVVCRSF